MIEFWEWLVNLQCLWSVLIHLYGNLQEGGCLSVWVTSSEGGSQMNGSHLRVASNLGNKFIVHKTLWFIYCIVSLWVIEICTIVSLAGFEPHTLESSVTHSAIWATELQFLHGWKQNKILPIFFDLSFCHWAPVCWICSSPRTKISSLTFKYLSYNYIG